MKILTNIRFVKVGGIAQALSSFIRFIDQSKHRKVKIVGIDVVGNGNALERFTEGSFTLLSSGLAVPDISNVIKASSTIKDVEAAYSEVIEAYRAAIIQEKPDVILINGTYYLPWCLLQASREFNIPTVIHYHGSITKETEHWKNEAHRRLFREMERQFDQPNLFYIFPSNLTKSVVEELVFRHKVSNFSILPNPVPTHFFAGSPKGKRKRIGIVGRWTRIKNPNFISRLAKYNAKHGNEFELNIVSDLGGNSQARKDLAGLVTFKRPMDNARLNRFYSSMGVVVSPSHFETYGNVAKEALASGVPALVSSQMGVAETFRELGLQDWVIDFRSVRDVYSKIREISGQEVTSEIRKELEHKHGPEFIHNQLLDILKSNL